MSFLRNILGSLKLSSSTNEVKSEASKSDSIKNQIDIVFRDYEFPKDIYSANKAILGCFFYQTLPFSLWKAEDAKLSEPFEVITKIPCQFLMIRQWFWYLSNNHGHVASSMLKDEFDHLIREMDKDNDSEINFQEGIDYYFKQIDLAIDHFNETSVDKKSLTTANGEKITLPWEYFFAMRILLLSEDSPYFNTDSSDFNGNEVEILKCLTHSTTVANLVFDKFKEHYVDFDAHKLQSWKWKTNAGLYEQHLKRRHNSKYFVEESRVVSAYDVYIARCKDAQEWHALHDEFLRLKKEILEDEATENPLDLIQRQREELDHVIDQVDRLGVGKNGLDIELGKLRESLIGIWRYIYENSNNTEGLKLLDKAESMSKNFSRKNVPDLINALGHSSVPSSDVMSCFLSLNTDDLKECVNHLQSIDGPLSEVRTGCLDFVRQHRSEFDDIDEVKEKLRIIGVAL